MCKRQGQPQSREAAVGKTREVAVLGRLAASEGPVGQADAAHASGTCSPRTYPSKLIDSSLEKPLSFLSWYLPRQRHLCFCFNFSSGTGVSWGGGKAARGQLVSERPHPSVSCRGHPNSPFLLLPLCHLFVLLTQYQPCFND